MTEHKKIPLPGEAQDAKTDSSSLLERANASFGINGFGGAPVPRDLPNAPIKRARVAKKPVAAPAEKVEQRVEPEQAPIQAPVPEAYTPEAEPPVHLPTVAARASYTEDDAQAVRLGGDAYVIDREYLREQAIIVPEDPVTELLEEFRIVKRQLIASARSAGTASARRILICSPHSGEGKTYCSANLGIAMAAEKGAEVLLVDADFAKPSLLETFGLPEGPGLMDALADPSIDLESLPMRTDIPGLWILPSGSRSLSDTEYLASSRTREVLDAFTQGAPDRIMIFDTPPALAASPVAELAKHVGQAVLVARADFTGHTALEDAYRLLSGCPDIKLMLNAAQFSPSGRRFGTYYGREG